MEKFYNLIIWITIAYITYSLFVSTPNTKESRFFTDMFSDFLKASVNVTIDKSSNDVTVVNSFNHTNVITGTTP